jgi:hypothetical protein
MPSLTRYGTVLASAFVVAGFAVPVCGFAAPEAQAATEHSRPQANTSAEMLNQLTNAEMMADLELQMLRAYEASKAGDSTKATDLIHAMKAIARKIDPSQLGDSNKRKIAAFKEGLLTGDDNHVQLVLASSLSEISDEKLAMDENILDGMRHYYAIGRAAALGDKQAAIREIKLAKAAFDAVDVDQLDERSKEAIGPVKEQVNNWAAGKME